MNTQAEMQEISVSLPNTSDDSVYVESVSGREGLGKCYEFTVGLLSNQPLDIEAMLGGAAQIKITVLDEELIANGVVSGGRANNPTQRREYCYSVTIVPELAMLAYSGQNQVYGTDRDVTVVDIVEGELSDANKAGSSTASSRVSRTIQHEMLAQSGDYPKLDFVMQYRESDFDFLSRICERFGVFYFFEQGDKKEKVVFCDRNENFRKLSGREIDGELRYRAAEQVRTQGEFSVREFGGVYRTQSGTVNLREYNDETPNVDLTVTENTTFTGQGVATGYGENYRTVPDGKFVAKRRVELLESQRVQFEGSSNVPLIRPGYFFELADHPISDFDGRYVVIEVEHDIVEATPLGFSSQKVQKQPYVNRFTCLRLDTPYRPPLNTPKPSVDGFLIAFVDGEEDDKNAQLDEYGRYRVRILEEESGLSGGQASAYVRKAEPYGGGDGVGSHSTLLVGTEILLGFLGGDPDRPVIVGALSNAENTSTVTDQNANVQFRTKTSSGAVFQISGSR